jgi:hypothetical protein
MNFDDLNDQRWSNKTMRKIKLVLNRKILEEFTKKIVF